VTPPASSEFVVVLTTLDAATDATSIARTLVEEQLAACVNVLPPMISYYRWQDAVESAREQQLLIKTTTAAVELLKERLAELHPYEVPEILELPITGVAASYANWLRESVATIDVDED
jgi:periplasmic divalent cation tolerance protein